MNKKNIKLNSLYEAKNELLMLSKSDNVQTKQWSLYKILVHCTQTIQYSMEGYPQMKPKLIRLTVGKIAIRKFLNHLATG